MFNFFSWWNHLRSGWTQYREKRAVLGWNRPQRCVLLIPHETTVKKQHPRQTINIVFKIMCISLNYLDHFVNPVRCINEHKWLKINLAEIVTYRNYKKLRNFFISFTHCENNKLCWTRQSVFASANTIDKSDLSIRWKQRTECFHLVKRAETSTPAEFMDVVLRTLRFSWTPARIIVCVLLQGRS